MSYIYWMTKVQKLHWTAFTFKILIPFYSFSLSFLSRRMFSFSNLLLLQSRVRVRTRWGSLRIVFLIPSALSKRSDKMVAGCCSCAEVFPAVCQMNRCHHMMDVLHPPSTYLPESRRERLELYSWWKLNLTYMNTLGARHPNSHESLSKCNKCLCWPDKRSADHLNSIRTWAFIYSN